MCEQKYVASVFLKLLVVKPLESYMDLGQHYSMTFFVAAVLKFLNTKHKT